jgi:hypothetical protein
VESWIRDNLNEIKQDIREIKIDIRELDRFKFKVLGITIGVNILLTALFALAGMFLTK